MREHLSPADVTSRNIFNYRQNRAWLIVRDLEQEGMDRLTSSRILLARGVFKWFSIRKWAINTVHIWKRLVTVAQADIVETKGELSKLIEERQHMCSCATCGNDRDETTRKIAKKALHLERLRGQLEGIEMCRGDMSGLFHETRWQAHPEDEDLLHEVEEHYRNSLLSDSEQIVVDGYLDHPLVVQFDNEQKDTQQLEQAVVEKYQIPTAPCRDVYISMHRNDSADGEISGARQRVEVPADLGPSFCKAIDVHLCDTLGRSLGKTTVQFGVVDGVKGLVNIADITFKGWNPEGARFFVSPHVDPESVPIDQVQAAGQMNLVQDQVQAAGQVDPEQVDLKQVDLKQVDPAPAPEQVDPAPAPEHVDPAPYPPGTKYGLLRRDNLRR